MPAQVPEGAVEHKSPFTDFSKAIDLSMLFDSSTLQLQVFATHSQSLSPLLQRETVVNIDGLLKGDGSVDTAVLHRLENSDDAPRYVTHFMFDRLRALILNCKLYSEGRNWDEMLQYARGAVSFRYSF